MDNHYRFEVILKPGETSEFVVEEKRDVQESVDVGRADVTRVRFFAAEQYLSPATRAFLSDIGGLMARKATLQRQINEWQDQTRRLSEEEVRLAAECQHNFHQHSLRKGSASQVDERSRHSGG